MNLHEGQKRVMLFLAILAGPMVFFHATGKGDFSLGSFIFYFILSLLVVGAIWGVYQMICWVLKGFEEKPRSNNE